MSRRSEQLGATLQRAIQDVLSRGLQDPRVSGMITVTSVRLSEDLRDVTAYVSVLPADRQDLTMHGLRSAASHIRHEVGDLVAVRQMPTISFKLDASLKKQAAVIEAIARANIRRPLAPEPGPEIPDQGAPTEEGRQG